MATNITSEFMIFNLFDHSMNTFPPSTVTQINIYGYQYYKH